MRNIVAISFAVMLGTVPVKAGEIELGGQWYKFEEVLIPGGPSHTFQRNGLSVTTGIKDDLLKRPARIMAILGTKWKMDYFPNSHLKTRFWGLAEPTFTVPEYDPMNYGVYFESDLVKPFTWKDGIEYEFRLTKGRLSTPQVIDLFRALSDIGGDVLTPYEEKQKGLRCVEFKGTLSWSNFDGRNGKYSRAKYFNYVFWIDSFKVMEYIPVRYSSQKIELEDAMARCTSKE